MPWVYRSPQHRGLKGRENLSRGSGGKTLATFQAAVVDRLPTTQGIDLRPQPWARLSRSVWAGIHEPPEVLLLQQLFKDLWISRRASGVSPGRSAREPSPETTPCFDRPVACWPSSITHTKHSRLDPMAAVVLPDPVEARCGSGLGSSEDLLVLAFLTNVADSPVAVTTMTARPASTRRNVTREESHVTFYFYLASFRSCISLRRRTLATMLGSPDGQSLLNGSPAGRDATLTELSVPFLREDASFHS